MHDTFSSGDDGKSIRCFLTARAMMPESARCCADAPTQKFLQCRQESMSRRHAAPAPTYHPLALQYHFLDDDKAITRE